MEYLWRQENLPNSSVTQEFPDVVLPEAIPLQLRDNSKKAQNVELSWLMGKGVWHNDLIYPYYLDSDLGNIVVKYFDDWCIGRFGRF